MIPFNNHREIKTLFEDCFYNLFPDAKYNPDLYLKLQKDYASEGRVYHNFAHILNGLSILDKQQSYWDISNEDYICLILAWFYHDIVYDYSPEVNNERESAERWKADIYSLYDNDPPSDKQDLIDKIYYAILATKHPDPPVSKTRINCIIHDLDLIGLANTDMFNLCSVLVDLEIRNMTDGTEIDIHKAQAKFWDSMLALDNIYWGEDFCDQGKETFLRRNNCAKENIKRHRSNLIFARIHV